MPGKTFLPHLSLWLRAGARLLIVLAIMFALLVALVLFLLAVFLVTSEGPSSTQTPVAPYPLKAEKPEAEFSHQKAMEIFRKYLDARAGGKFDAEKGLEILQELQTQFDLVKKTFTLQDILIGGLNVCLYLAGLLVLPVAFFLLRRYRRAVIASMARQISGTAAPPQAGAAPLAPSASPAAPLRIVTQDRNGAGIPDPAAQKLYHRLLQAPRRAAVLHTIAGACFACLMAAAFCRAAQVPGSPCGFLLSAWIYLWPLVVTLSMLLGSTAWVRLLPAAAYVAGFAFLIALARAFQPDLSVSAVFQRCWSLNAVPTALVLACLSRPVRAVGPLVLTFIFVGVMGVQVLFFSLIYFFPLNLMLTDMRVFYGHLVAVVVIFLAFAALGWFLLQGIRVGYEKKKISDQSLTQDSLWLLFGLHYSVSLAGFWPGWLAAGPMAFLVSRLVLFIGFQTAGSDEAPGVRLLLLRVFSLGRRSTRLFHALGLHWRYGGSIEMIVGPDLATTTVEPHEFLSFLTGKLARRFIDSPATLDRRLAEMDINPDHDWRFRVNDFFCFDDTWKMALLTLVAETDVVLMDLRGFSPERAGCIYEINELIDQVPLERVRFIMDPTTAAPFLHRIIHQAWDELSLTSPNRACPDPQLHLLNYTGSGSKSLNLLLHSVCEAARPARPCHNDLRP